MIQLNVNRLLKMRGIKFGAVWLSERGLSYKQAIRAVKGTAKTVSLDLLLKLCVAFECTPNELLEYKPAPKQVLPYLTPLMRNKFTASPQELLAHLPQAEVERLLKEMQGLRTGRDG